MKKALRKDKCIRQTFVMCQYNKFILSYSCNNFLLFNSIRTNLCEDILRLPKNSSLNRCVSRCIFTGRRKRLNKWFSVSRLVLIRFFRLQKIFGWKKAKW